MAVTTTARLHFGFLDPSGKSARPFGSFGLSLDRPCTRVTLKSAERNYAAGPEASRAARYLAEMTEGTDAGPVRLDVVEAIPSHAGLGSGTQLALAVGMAFATSQGLDLSPMDIARRLGRGTRSGIGIATFEAGGAVLDSGPGADGVPHLVTRVRFPDDWRVLLIFDPDARGLEGTDEIAAFEALPAFPEAERKTLETSIVERALPALKDRQFEAFCTEVGQLQRHMGAYFAPLQGGAFTSGRVARVVQGLREIGATGVGQSSWGPTGFAFAASEDAGQRLLETARTLDETSALGFALARGRNRGAEITANSAKPG